VTSLSPLQFQKQLRLIEARRMMLADGAPPSNAAYAVGYESVPQFTRAALLRPAAGPGNRRGAAPCTCSGLGDHLRLRDRSINDLKEGQIARLDLFVRSSAEATLRHPQLGEGEDPVFLAGATNFR
jgi:hypothetical protein